MHKQTNLPRVGEEPVAQVHPRPGRRRKRRRRRSRHFTAQAAARQGQLSLILTTSPIKRECGVRVQPLLLHDSSLPSSSSHLPVSSLRSRLLHLLRLSSPLASSPSASASSWGRRAGLARLGPGLPAVARSGLPRLRCLPWPGSAQLPALPRLAPRRSPPLQNVQPKPSWPRPVGGLGATAPPGGPGVPAPHGRAGRARPEPPRAAVGSGGCGLRRLWAPAAQHRPAAFPHGPVPRRRTGAGASPPSSREAPRATRGAPARGAPRSLPAVLSGGTIA